MITLVAANVSMSPGLRLQRQSLWLGSARQGHRYCEASDQLNIRLPAIATLRTNAVGAHSRVVRLKSTPLHAGVSPRGSPDLGHVASQRGPVGPQQPLELGHSGCASALFDLYQILQRLPTDRSELPVQGHTHGRKKDLAPHHLFMSRYRRPSSRTAAGRARAACR